MLESIQLLKQTNPLLEREKNRNGMWEREKTTLIKAFSNLNLSGGNIENSIAQTHNENVFPVLVLNQDRQTQNHCETCAIVFLHEMFIKF